MKKKRKQKRRKNNFRKRNEIAIREFNSIFINTINYKNWFLEKKMKNEDLVGTD